jgi:protein SCO1/2
MKSITLLLMLCCLPLASIAESLPNNSIYHIGSTWVDQNNETVEVAQLRSHIQVVAFVYTYCEHSCPIIMQRLKKIYMNISLENKTAVHFSLFSLDPKRDTPEKLKAFQKKHELNDKQWSFYNGDPEDVLELAALVGVRYKPMNNDNDDIAHSNMITILDKQGRIVHQVKGFAEDLHTVLNVINELSIDSAAKL